jgi:hypothetical protein
MIVPNHRERQLMQYLRGGWWVMASTLPAGTRLIEGMLRKGWIEQQEVAGEIYYRMTEGGLAAKTARVPINS